MKSSRTLGSKKFRDQRQPPSEDHLIKENPLDTDKNRTLPRTPNLPSRPKPQKMRDKVKREVCVAFLVLVIALILLIPRFVKTPPAADGNSLAIVSSPPVQPVQPVKPVKLVNPVKPAEKIAAPATTPTPQSSSIPEIPAAKMAPESKKIPEQQKKKNDLLATATPVPQNSDKKTTIKSLKQVPVVFPVEKQAPAKPNREKNVLDKVITDPVTGMQLVLVPGGCYQRGSNEGNWDERPVNTFCVEDFYLGKYEVTQYQYRFVTGKNPARFKGGNRPVERVSWNDTQDYLQRLNHQTLRNYRLPTEAEWEYAARSGGRDEKFAGIDNDSVLTEYAWFNQNSGGATQPVGQRLPNGLDLYDMSGNVWEWCADRYQGAYDGKILRNSQGETIEPPERGNPIIRGGCWAQTSTYLRSTNRYRFPQTYRNSTLGFRIAISAHRLFHQEQSENTGSESNGARFTSYSRD